MKLTKLEFKTELKLSAEFIRTTRQQHRSLQSQTSKLETLSPQAGELLDRVRKGYRDAEAAFWLWGAVSGSVRYCGLVYGLRRGRTLEQMERTYKEDRCEATLKHYQETWDRLEALEASGQLAVWQAWFQGLKDVTLAQRMGIVRMKNQFLAHGLPACAPGEDPGTIALSWEIPGARVLVEINPEGKCYVFVKERCPEEFYEAFEGVSIALVHTRVTDWMNEYQKSRRRQQWTREQEQKVKQAKLEEAEKAKRKRAAQKTSVFKQLFGWVWS